MHTGSPSALGFTLLSWQVFLVPAVRAVAAHNPDIQVFIKKASTRKENIIF